MIAINKNYRNPFIRPATNHAALAVKNEAADFILGKRTDEPTPLSGRVRQGKIHLCQVGEQNIFLHTNLIGGNKHRPVIRCVREADGSIKALVYSSDAWRRNVKDHQETKGPSEIFTVYDAAKKQIIYDAWPDESQPEVSQAASAKPAKSIKLGPAIADWIQGLSETAPDPIERKVKSNGSLHLCNFAGEPILLPLGMAYARKAVRITFRQSGSAYYAVVDEKLKFCFYRDGRANYRPPAQELAAA